MSSTSTVRREKKKTHWNSVRGETTKEKPGCKPGNRYRPPPQAIDERQIDEEQDGRVVDLERSIKADPSASVHRRRSIRATTTTTTTTTTLTQTHKKKETKRRRRPLTPPPGQQQKKTKKKQNKKTKDERNERPSPAAKPDVKYPNETTASEKKNTKQNTNSWFLFVLFVCLFVCLQIFVRWRNWRRVCSDGCAIVHK